jgi:hypothetical protein
MDEKASGGIDWLYLWHQLKEQEHAGPVLTTVAVVLFTYMLYTVSRAYPSDYVQKIAVGFFSIFIG